MNNEQMKLEQKKITLERIRDILLKNGATQVNLDNICAQIDDVLQKMMDVIGTEE